MWVYCKKKRGLRLDCDIITVANQDSPTAHHTRSNPYLFIYEPLKKDLIVYI